MRTLIAFPVCTVLAFASVAVVSHTAKPDTHNVVVAKKEY